MDFETGAVEKERRDLMHCARFLNITAFFVHRISSLDAYTSPPWEIFDVAEIKWKLGRREICFTKLHFTIVNMIIIVYKNIHFFDVLQHVPSLTLIFIWFVCISPNKDTLYRYVNSIFDHEINCCYRSRKFNSVITKDCASVQSSFFFLLFLLLLGNHNPEIQKFSSEFCS